MEIHIFIAHKVISKRKIKALRLVLETNTILLRLKRKFQVQEDMKFLQFGININDNNFLYNILNFIY